MNRTIVPLCAALILQFLVLPSVSVSQDSLTTLKPRQYTSFGFSASFVSGIGISLGANQEDSYRLRVTGGFVTSGDIDYYSYGMEFEFDLAKHKPYRVFVGPGVGGRGQSNGDTHGTLGLCTGFEAPVTGSTIFDNVSGGVQIFYPTYYFLAKTIGFGGGMFITYNF